MPGLRRLFVGAAGAEVAGSERSGGKPRLRNRDLGTSGLIQMKAMCSVESNSIEEPNSSL